MLQTSDLPPYLHKTEPFAHQAEAFRLSRRKECFALWMEPRTGKSKVIIDTAADLYDAFLSAGGWGATIPSSLLAKPPAKSQLPAEGITGVVVIAAPGRVHRNWATKEVPLHLPDRTPSMSVVWEADHISWSKEEGWTGRLWPRLEELLRFRGLAWLLVNEGAVLTKAFRRYAPLFLRVRRTLSVADEYTLIMPNPGSKHYRVMEYVGRHSEYRRILDGTPAETPLGYYAPFRFMDWRILGFREHSLYKARYAEWEDKRNWGTGQDYKAIAKDGDGQPKYRNLDEQREKLARVSYRVRFRDCWDVPRHVYQEHSFQLSAEQRRVYDRLREEYAAELSCGHEVKAQNVLVRYLRLQQVCSNYWPSERVGLIHDACEGEGCAGCDDLGVVAGRTEQRAIDRKRNPRLEAMAQVAERNRGARTIVWARFNEDVDQVIALMVRMKVKAVQYDGRVAPADRDRAEADFNLGKATTIVAKESAMGRGLGFPDAELMVYYSNQLRLLTRLQSEERATHRDRKAPLGVVDLVAEDTVDDRVIIPSFRAKKRVFDYVLGELNGGWI